MAAPAFIERDKFAVDRGCLYIERCERLRDRRIAVCPVLAIARDETHLMARNQRLHAVAIEFQLVDPVLTRGWLVT